VFFSTTPVHDYDAARAADGAAFARFHAAMLERGIYLPPSPFEAWFPSLAHGEAEVEATLQAAGEAFEAIAG
jgi:glutamate-1-semialdehyde 2,1-aminomutase